jgi:hydroxymethylpyrimidine pyrophosphatase-like HAD family hydrolase
MRKSMYRRVLAFDFDGTLAEKGVVPPALQSALERLHTSRHALFLVTGRRFGDADLGSFEDSFTGIVWENGAVLQHTATDEAYLPFGHVDPHLVEALEQAGVPLQRGRAIITTDMRYDKTVWQVLRQWGGGAVVVHDRGTVGILPPGAAKGAGLERLLHLCGFSPRNVVSFGNGESDLSLLQLGEIGVAVADAVPRLKEAADLVTDEPGPAGVLDTLQRYWLDQGPHEALQARQRKHLIPLGSDETGAPVSLPAAELAAGTLGVFGDSGSGKSWVAGLLVEGMHHAGYQILMIDPEGDFRGMQVLPGIVGMEVTQDAIPPPRMVVTLLETVTVSLVLDLSSYPVARRDRYVTDLLRALHPLREHKFRPHWIVLEEAQHFLPPQDNQVSAALLPLLAGGGWTFVSYCPNRLSSSVLAALDHCILTRLSDAEATQALRHTIPGVSTVPLADIPRGYAWLCAEHVVRLRPNARRVPHVRHLYKYLETPLPAHKRFRFCDKHGFLHIESASLLEFLHCLRKVPLESLAYHQARGDFARWVGTSLGDAGLADHLRKLAQRPLEGEALRKALAQRVASHYEELQALRRRVSTHTTSSQPEETAPCTSL